MRKFLYLALICGLISGAGIFMEMPHYPTPIIPISVAVIGILCALLTITDKETNKMLTLGGILINLMPLLAAFLIQH